MAEKHTIGKSPTWLSPVAGKRKIAVKGDDLLEGEKGKGKAVKDGHVFEGGIWLRSKGETEISISKAK